ncbi:MAG: DUF2892 domain-containing protein [Acidimicrobiales bacterium]|nr:DUF2892 domain-containing protein [Acidimicrobiales bacterium]
MTNEAGWDRVARVVLGMVLLVVGFGVLGGTAGVIVGVVALVPLLTGIIGFCPLYAVFGIRTNRTEQHTSPR